MRHSSQVALDPIESNRDCFGTKPAHKNNMLSTNETATGAGQAAASAATRNVQPMPPNATRVHVSAGNANGSSLNVPPLLSPKPRDDASTPKDFVCAVCFELPISANEALITPCCHHVFCKNCILRAIQTSPACPLDRKGLATSHLKKLDELSKRIFEAIPVVCPRNGCTWEGCLGNYRNHAEDCALEASVSEMSKLELAKKLRKAEKDCGSLQISLNGMYEIWNRYKQELLRVRDKNEILGNHYKMTHMVFSQERKRLMKKVSELEKEKAELVTIFTSPENDWSNRLRKRGRT